jgi:uroporphyrinogen decarboxylase
MTARERIANVLAGKSVDRFPVHTSMSGFSCRKYIERYGISDRDLQRTLNPDGAYRTVLPDCRAARKPADPHADWYDELGVGWKQDRDQDIGPMNVTAPITDLDDIKTYRFPDVAASYSFTGVKDAVSKADGTVFVVANQATGTFFNKYRFLRGFEEGLIDMMVHQDEAAYLLDRLLEYQLELAKRFIATGVHAVTTGDDVAMQKGLVINPDVWRQLIKPRQKKLNQLYKDAGLPVIHHCCGDCRDIIPDYIETGVDCLNPVQPEAMPIEALAENYGKDICFYGGVGVQSVMQHGTPQDVDNAVEQTLHILGRHGRYIVGPSHTIQDCIPSENVHAYFEAVAKYNQ